MIDEILHVYGFTKNRVVRVSEIAVGVWDGLDDCEISRPEILSQSVA